MAPKPPSRGGSFRGGPPSRNTSSRGGPSRSGGPSRGGAPSRGGSSRGPAGRGASGDRPFSDRPKRDFGDRPQRGERPFNDRPKRDFGDRPQRGERPFNDRPKRDFNDRPQRDERAPSADRHSYKREGFGASRHFDEKRPSGKKPGGGRTAEQRAERPSRGLRGERPFSDRPKRDFGDRPQRSFDDRSRRDDRPRFDDGNEPIRDDRPYEDRVKRDHGARPKRDFNDRPQRDERPRPTARKGFDKRPPDADNPQDVAAAIMKGHEMLLYGVHAVQAALRNPNRVVTTIWATENGKEHLQGAFDKDRHPPVTEVDKRALSGRLPEGAVHQGIAIAVEPLADVFLSDVIAASMTPNAQRQIVVILDEVSDPHNVGAVMRSMSAFSATALIVHKRNAPGVTGVMAKIATGALEHIPMVPVTNLAQAMQELQMAGFYCLGLDERADFPIQNAPKDKHVALVLGAEGDGLRAKTRSTCDAIATIETFGQIESLNVSNAAAIALYALTAK